MGVEEKKALRSLTETFENETLPRLKKATTNAGLTHELKIDETLDARALKIAAANLNEDIVVGIEEVCKDPDYRGEFAKIQKFVFEVVPNTPSVIDGVNGNIKLDKTSLIFTLDGYHSVSNGQMTPFVAGFKTVF